MVDPENPEELRSLWRKTREGITDFLDKIFTFRGQKHGKEPENAFPQGKTGSMFDSFYTPRPNTVVLDNGVELFYTDSGRGSPCLVFIHGLGSNHKCWRKNITYLAGHFRCISLDLPGYGHSSKEDYPYSMRFFSDCISLLVQKLGLREVCLVGHSMGGQIAVLSHLAKPALFQGLVLIAPAGFETFSEPERQWIKNIYNPLLLKATPVDQIRRNFEVNFFQFPDDARFMLEDRLAIRETTEYDRYCQMIPQCVSAMLAEPVFDRLPEVMAPTLVLFGADDLLIPNKMLHPALDTLKVAESGTERIPGARLELFSPAGHFVQWECHRQVNEAIARHLRRNHKGR